MSGPRILVVDDDEGVRDALKDALEDLGYGVITAANGREALERMSQLVAPSLVLLDLMMPETSGWDVLDVLAAKGTPPGMSVVVMTAARPDKVPPGMTFLRKPFDLDALLGEVRRRVG